MTKIITQQVSFIALTIFLITFQPQAAAQNTQENQDCTSSPFFFVKSPDGKTDQLPLKETTARVQISGIIADVTVEQTYCNTGEVPLEAIYIFPASTKAAVYAMQMQVGDRLLKAEIRESEQARTDYESAKEEGKTATLLEQKRPNVFQMNVANILPGDTIRVKLNYTELLVPEETVYEFVYPTVVGPRYAGESSGNDNSWVEIPYTHEGEAPLYDFHLSARIDAGMEIREIHSPSHPAADFKQITPETVLCDLPAEDSKSGNRDFVLRYSLSGEEIQSGMLLYEGEDENFFLTMVQPPARPDDSDIPPREYVFIMDVSGSMNGFPISVSKVLLSDLISGLRPTDKFNVICFAGGSQILSDRSLDATQENITKALDFIDKREGGGGTNLLSALEKALALPGTEAYSRTFVIATDGYVTVEKEAFDLIRNSLSKANFFAFGIGSSVNRYLIDGIAHVGMGEPFVVLDVEEAIVSAEKFRKYIASPVLTNISLTFDGFGAYETEPLTIPDVFAERPVIIFGKWKGSPKGSVQIKGLSGNHSLTEKMSVADFIPSPEYSALKYLWARYVIQRLDDYGKAGNMEGENLYIKDIITDLGLKYHLLTRYTSFIAIDSLIRNQGDKPVTVTQPLPLPSGVSDLAVGGGYGGAANTSLSMEFYKAGGYDQITENRSGIVKIYPNPVSSRFRVWIRVEEKDMPREKKLMLFDQLGHLIKIMEINNLNDSYISVRIDLSDTNIRSSGTYRVALLIDGKTVSSRNILISGAN